MAIAAAISCVRLQIAADGSVSGDFEPSTLTAVLLALIWLPPLLRVIALAGGAVKTPAGEATTGGLLDLMKWLDPDTKRDALPPLLAALNSPEIVVHPQRRVATHAFRRELEMQLAPALPQAGGVREQLDAYATAYESVRRTMPSGRDRTLRMTTLMAEARAVAQAHPLAAIDLQHMLESARDGERVIALALAQDQPDVRFLEPILRVIAASRSAFEQYQALGAALEITPKLNAAEREQLERTVRAALDDPERAIAADASRARLANALLRQVDAVNQG